MRHEERLAEGLLKNVFSSKKSRYFFCLWLSTSKARDNEGTQPKRINQQVENSKQNNGKISVLDDFVKTTN